MPNWCENKLTITGSHAALAEFVERAFGTPAHYPQTAHSALKDEPCTEKHLCFNATVPTPQEVLDTGYSNSKITSDAGVAALLTGTYEGPMDGYWWSIQNWGTKWDIYYEQITPESMGWCDACEQLQAYFDTAWTQPEAWLFKTAPLFPELKFHLFYAEPGCYFAGELTVQGNDVEHHPYSGAECDAIFQAEQDED